MAIPTMAAWRNLDGTYTLRTMDPLPEPVGHWYHSREDTLRAEIKKAGGVWDAKSGKWIVPVSALQPLGAYPVFIVILAGFCCAPVSSDEVRARDLERGKVFRVYCPKCGKRSPTLTLWDVPIVEFCGEGEEGLLTYEAAFQSEIEGR